MATSYVITEAILLITAILAASIFYSTMYTLLSDFGQLQRENAQQIKRELQLDFEIVFVSANAGDNKIYVWIKNTGYSNIHEELLKLSEFYLKTSDRFTAITYGNSIPGWLYTIVNDVNNDGKWSPGETISAVIQLDYTLTTGDYLLKFVAYTGKDRIYYFSV